jgi:GDPmannose 4,6-dehydratase
MWLMLQQDAPDDYVLATGEARSVREFIERAFRHVGRELVWRGHGVDEKGYDRKSDQCLVAVDPGYFRPTEVDLLVGNAAKAHKKLGWRHTTTFDQLVEEMMENDLTQVAGEPHRYEQRG